MRRVSIVGNSGSGKTTLGRALAAHIGAAYVELDSIFHQPGWTALPRDDFRHRVAALAAADAWVIDGNYSAVRDLVWDRADTVVWLDLPRRVVFPRVVTRTLRRRLRREELWNGNRESWREMVSRDPRENILLWSWTQHGRYAAQYAELLVPPPRQDLRVVRLRSRADVVKLLADAG